MRRVLIREKRWRDKLKAAKINGPINRSGSTPATDSKRQLE
jgi:hypothetical protein